MRIPSNHCPRTLGRYNEDFYLALVNSSFKDALAKPVAKGDLNGKLPRITRRLEEYFEANPLKGGASFNHFRPARHFLDELGKVAPSDDTLARFEEAFVELNKLVKT